MSDSDWLRDNIPNIDEVMKQLVESSDRLIQYPGIVGLPVPITAVRMRSLLGDEGEMVGGGRREG